jgi:hypothetical protein
MCHCHRKGRIASTNRGSGSVNRAKYSAHGLHII